MDSERITLGSGKLYCIKFTGEIPDDATIETEDNQLAHIKGGASLEYTAESYTAKDDLGVVQKTKVTKEEATLKAGLLTWCATTLEKLCATARVTATAKKRTVKIGGLKNQKSDKYLIRFLHEDDEDGDIRVTIVGKNEAGFSFTFATDAETTLEPVGTGAVAAAMNLDDGYDIIITKTGATGEALDDLNKRMNNIFKDIPTDAETAGTAIGGVNTRFQLTGDKLESLSKQFIEFAEINETDLNSSIDNVDTILNKFNVDAGQAGNVLGLLTKVGQDTGLSMDTLESSLMQNGSTLKEMGLGITESVNLLAMFENNGVDATTAMAGLKKAVKNYTAEGLSTDQALQKTIDSIKNASTETEALSIAQETFGSKGFAEMAQAIREGKLSVDDLGGSLEDYGTTVQDTYESTLDPWDNAKVMLNNLKLAGSDLAGTALSALQPAIEKVTSTVQSATEWFRGLTDNQKEMIATIVMIVAANNRAHGFKNIDGYIEVDSENMNAYKGDTLQNNKMLVGAFPKLAAGDNNISWAGNVTKIEIVPRWCKL